MAVGPQLLGIQPNEGSLLVDGQVRHTAPDELVFRFDDRVGLDPNSLGGIRLIRSGDDGAFERASMATDLGSGGQALVEFYAAQPGQVGNGIQIQFTQANRSDSRLPVVRITGRTVQVEVNSNPLLETRVDDLLRVFDQTNSTPVTDLVYALRLRGPSTLPIGRTVNTAAPVVLGGANSAKVTTDFGTGANTQVRLNAKASGAEGIGVQVNVTTRDRGGPGAPVVTVDGKVISIELNSNTRYASTVGDFVAALNGNSASSALVEATLISGVAATRLGTLPVTYSPLVLGGVTDVEIVPGYVGLGDTSREVIMRFAEALPDDKYRVEILGRGSRALLNANGQAFNDGIDKSLGFELDLGAKIEAIVPQPVERNAQGQLVANANRIDVYFNNDDLIDLARIRTVNGLTIDQLRAQRPTMFLQNSDVIVDLLGNSLTAEALSSQFYQLYHLAGTLSNVDDTPIPPTAVRYYPDADRVTLTFSRPLDQLVNPATNAPLARGELRLRIGTSEPKPLPPLAYAPVGDARDTFAGADNLETIWKPGLAGFSQSVLINSEIRNTSPFLLDFPGGSDEIGNRFNRMQDHLRRNADGTLVTADSEDGTALVFYNFQTQLGRFTGTTLLNSITEQQKQRTREVLSLYERYLGVRFVETENLGLTIAVGDTRAVDPFPETTGVPTPGVITLNSLGAEYLESGFLGTGQLATVLDSQDFGNSTGNEFGGPFSRAVMQGIGNLLGLGNTDDLAGFTTQAFSAVLAPGIGTEIVLPGDAEIVHGQYLYRPDSKDIDLYQFRLPANGRLSIEAFAERMSRASLLDSQIRLYQQQPDLSWIEVAGNDDYFSSDSFIELDLAKGNYIVGVSASGNNQYDPSIADSGLGGRSQGAYQLRMDFRPPAGAVLRDATGTELDGDADGQAGGVFDFWFRPSGTANTKYVDKSATTTGNGSINSPFKFVKDALAAAVPGDVVRIVGNGGADQKLNTPADNLAYEIGFDALGRALPDGTTLDVPKDVSVFIDAGAVLKMRRSRVGVGSTSASVDRSGGSLLVLGTPVLVDVNGAVLKDASGVASAGSVYFTSISDTTLGKGGSAAINNATPLPGDWGGIDFRNRIDNQDESHKNYERLGQFLNSVSHADLRYGGGQVVVDGVSQVITPIQMVDARPTVIFSDITMSADAAMSASPNSFLESNFHTPDQQRGGLFTADYDRVGPEIHGNTLTGNSINALQVRARTSGGSLESMTVSGRFDDTDIVHVITENLQIAGTPGGFLSDVNAPPTTIVTLTVQAGGTLPVGSYNYRLTYVDASGNESLASNPTQTIDVLTAGSSIVLQNLPPVPAGSAFVARRLYRSDATGNGNYVLVRELNASSSTFVDTGTSLGVPLNEASTLNAPPVTGVTLTDQAGGSLSAGIYSYRLTYIDASGIESPASNSTIPLDVPTNPPQIPPLGWSIKLDNLPTLPAGSPYVARRLYRSTDFGAYVLVQALDTTSSSFVDNGATIGTPLNEGSVAVRARLDGRLAIDPGIVVKLQGSRIDVQSGAQLIAEGTADRPVVFTSTSDVRYGAGGTFETAQSTQAAAIGNWGGIYVGPTSSASLDHAVIAYGGGTTRVEGGFADFNAIETHQGDLRLTHSRLEANAAGNGTATDSDRGGRGTNDGSVIFIRGAQPVIVDNTIINNRGAGISTNVSALNSQIVTDWGRSTGALERASNRLDNQGPLVSGNRFDANAMNGMSVRAGVLTTEGVWDDTDVVHIVTGRIEAPDFHAYGGLRLQSSATQSLVVKLLSNEGSVAGLAATGSELDNADHIGGSVQLVGTPGNPVIMTSLYDCSVGVGFTPDGRPQTDTLSLGACQTRVDVVPFADILVVMDDSASMTFAQQFSAQLMQDIDAALRAAGIGATAAGGNQFGLVAYGGATTDTTPLAMPLGPNGALFSTAVDYAAAVQTLQASGGIEDGYLAIEYALDTYQFRQQAEKFVLLVTNEDRDVVDDTKTYASVLAKLRAKDVTLDGIVSADFRDARNVTALAVDADKNAYTEDGTGGYIVSANGSVRNSFFFDTTVPDYVNLIYDTEGIAGDIEQIQAGGTTAQSFGSVLVDSLVAQAGGSVNLPEPGDWNSVLIGPQSNDRNVAAVTEIESPQSVSPGSNGKPESGEFLGDLAPALNTSDETRRLGFQVQGVIANPSDVDVYSFRGTAGTEVWLDIDRTLNSLDTVVELVDANGRILALSDNSLAEEANASLLYVANDMPSQSVHSLRKSTPELYLKSATGAPKDLYSTNPRDAGMRVVLPGEPGSSVQYHVRVRSSNLREGDAASRLLDPALLGAGLTRGAYQLQLRLRETDEVPGSGVTYADLRYATNGIEIVGMPGHSPLLGETAESTVPNNTPATAQPIGNILTTDRQALSIAGSLDSFTDVDWYSFNINYTAVRPTGLREYFATVFDVDYADGIGRPDTSIYVFDAQGRLILSGLGSNLVDDQSGGLSGAGNTDQSRGSAGSLDPFIGSAEMPVGQYFLAVTNSERVPGVLETYTSATASGAVAAVRMQPINGIQLIAEDHVGFTGGSTAVVPQTPVLFPQNNSAVQFNLSDVNLYVTQNVGTNATNVYMVNPFTGDVANTVGRFALNVQDVAFRYNGQLRAFDWSPQFPNGNVDQDGLMDYINIDPGTAAATPTGALNLSTFHVDGTNAADSNDGIYPNAITFANIGGQERGFIVGSRGFAFPRANVGTTRPGVDYTENIIYEFDENSGNATSAPGGDKTGIATGFNAGTAVLERGYIETSRQGAAVTGLISRETTRVLADGTTVALINDGDSFTLLDSANFTAVFEFDSGPEVRVNWNPTIREIADGSQFKLDGVVYEFETLQGTPGVSPGAIAIPINARGSYRQFVEAIARHVNSGITVTSEGNRLTFGGATIGDFTQLQNQGIFVDQGSTGNVSPGAIKVPFLSTDSAVDLAARMVIAINSSGIPGLSATSSGAQVNISGGTVVDAGTLNEAGAPGGTITGAAVINGVMYAVSDAGGLFRVSSPTSINFGNVGTYVASSYELLGIRFTGLSAGPAHMQNGAFAQTLFGIDEDGMMYAFDTAGRLLPIFAGGATSIDTGLFGATGLSFSTLDYNLWHVSNNRGAETGHGLPVPFDASRGNRVEGGNSLYFGFESAGANGVNVSGVTDPTIRNSYDFPGGAAGAIESQTFDLSGLSSGDLPTLYFNYRFDTEQAGAAIPLAQSPTDYMRDALRVYVSGEDGQWVLAATNNSTRGIGNFDDEFDPLLTGNNHVQELFDNNGQWRQARVPLDDFAGQANVKLRIEFSSAGGFGFGLRGGQGPQLRLLSGDRLADGQTVIIGGRRFEIEMGPSLSVPAGSSISNGDSVTIEGVNYVFTDGSGPPVTSPNVAVPFTASQSAAQVAETLFDLIRVTARPQAAINLTASEQNDTLTSATIGTQTGDSAIITVTGSIGDNSALADPTSDVDLVRLDLARGSMVLAQVNALSIGSTLDTYLRVFDSQGRQLAFNDNRFGSTDSQIAFVAPSDGTYYFGVSGAGNASYNASVLGTGTGASSGSYQLVLDVVRQLNAVRAGERIQLEGAAHVAVSGGSVLLQGALGTAGEAIYVNAAMTANQVGQALQQTLARVYADGSTTAFTLRGDTLDLTGLVQYDSFDPITGLRQPSLQQLNPGPFGATTHFVGDAFGAFNASTDFAGNRNNANPGALRAQTNAFEGVYLDDFIIGVAGRGEMVLNAPVETNFVQDPQLSLTSPVTDNVEVLVGPYQVEIRGGSEYGTPRLDGRPQTLLLDRAVAPQERLSEGVSIIFNGASSLVAGSTFTISDGTRQLTFELDNIDDAIGTQPGNVPVPFSNAAFDSSTNAFPRMLRSESAQTIAARVRDIINSAAVQSVLDINAILINSDASGESSSTVVLIGQANVNVPASVGQTVISQGDGDSNRQREQGQVVVRSAKVTNSRAFGVRIDAGGRDELGVSQGGSPRNLLTLNTDRLSTGAVVMNSELVGNLSGGISVAGEPVTSGVAAAVPYARLVNNTIVGTVDRTNYRDRPFADSVISYLPGLTGASPAKGLDDPAAALNGSDYGGTGEPTGVEGAVSLGRGGQLTVEFTNNFLIADGTPSTDLTIQEVGVGERYLVEASTDGIQYVALGVGVGVASFDVDAAFNTQARVRYIRITDDGTNFYGQDAAGADIDAVVATSSLDSETGIRVVNNASPTILNSVITNSPVGLQVDASSGSTVVGGMVYHRNTANTAGSATLGQFPQVVESTRELFTDVLAGNLYPAVGSPIIDSSMDSLQDRLSLVSVKNSIGIGASPILAPQYDINGSLRVDDPNVASPAGLGENVFKDRGAQDRADSVGPSVVLLEPADNDVAGLDGNPATSVVELTNFTARFFDIQLYDGLEPSDPNRGSNIDDSTVSSSSVLVYKDNVPLVEGIDYRFGYDATTNVIRLTPLAGVFSSSSVYQIRFVNVREFAISTQITSPSTTDGTTIDIVDANDGETTFEIDTGYYLSVPTSDGVAASVVEGGVFTLDDGTRRLRFEFDTDGTVGTGNLAVPLSDSPTVTEVAELIETAIDLSGLQLSVVDLGSGNLQIDGSVTSAFDPGTSGLLVTGRPGVRPAFGLQIPLVAGRPVTFADGESFTIRRTSVPVTFELDTNGVVTPGRIPVRFTAGANAATIGQALVTAIRNAGLGLLPTYDGNGLVTLGGDANTVLGLSNTQLLQAGTAGQAAARPIKLSLADGTDPAEIATQIANAINAAGLPGVEATAFGDRVVIAGATDVSGSQVDLIQGITDNAGNPLKANQVDGSSTLTIFLGEGMDYGSAPDPIYTSKRENNGPRHTVVPGFSLGTDVRPDADASPQTDDGVQFTQALVAAFQSSVTVEVNRPQGTDAYLSGWIDYNHDGVFSTSERIANALPITQQFTTLSFVVSGASTVGTTYARFRVSSDAASIAAPTGAAQDGEVEDYQVTIVANPFQSPSNRMDVNGDGHVSPIDVLQVINYLNSGKPTTLTLPATDVPPYIDVNGDGSVSPIDALLVINYLNTLPPGGGEGEGEGEGTGLAANVETVHSGDWLQGITNLAAPSVTGRTSPKTTEEVPPRDAFFATMDEEDDLVADFDAAGNQLSAYDAVIDGFDGMAADVDDEMVSDQVGRTIRQRLAGFFRS